MKPLEIRTPEDAIAAVPYMLGFHPSDSIVCVGFDGPESTCAIRQDLPRTDCRAAEVLAGNGFRRALLLGYGPAAEVAEAAGRLHTALTEAGLQVLDMLHVTGGRWRSLACADQDCCPPEGRRYDSSASRVAAEATLAGHVALAGRAELARTIAPLEGPARAAMRRATARAEARYFGLGRGFRSRADREGRELVAGLLDRARSGAGPPDDDEVAWLGVLLTGVRVRDEAWVRIDEDDPAADIAFWRDFLRRVEDRYAAPPATLLAFAAYAAGDGALANVVLDRALEADPAYSAAIVIRDLINAGIPPGKARIRMTPEDLAAVYADDEQPTSHSPPPETRRAS
ncbi:DUF4192 domain-containing protein [Actinomadura macrotermitis]|uniref:DUF4192 domain-containing protein n=1 Tax=Actinomadura macrotermitis TaxID=2585200 RepID=A0A7K0C6G4_9ACTN|nr:DUF4192 domain-containing protein [Actinomadura macrotermitis]MQY08394.1 hypothetical protein [Actinomadura macrotermitis]